MEIAEKKSVAAQARKVLATLTPAEEAKLREKFGIAEAAVPEEAGQDFEETRRRIREIEARALAKLRRSGSDEE